jgi:hypothetical protein
MVRMPPTLRILQYEDQFEMPATHPIITKRVGEGGTAGFGDIKRIQQLLARAGFLQKNQITGSWGKAGGASATAWNDFQLSKGWVPKPYVDPVDAEDRLAYLASAACVLLWMPDYLRSLSAITVLTDFAIACKIPYGWGDKYGEGTRSIYGFEGRSWAMVFLEGSYFDVGAADARSFNCCAFANVLLSVWMQGNIHAAPYNASQAVGGDGTQLGTRYGMPEIKNSKGAMGISSLDELKSVMTADRIYHMALCRDSTGTFTKHDVIVVNNTVFQSNILSASPNGTGVYVKSLDDVWQNMSRKRVRLFGPGPF